MVGEYSIKNIWVGRDVVLSIFLWALGEGV